MSNEDPFLSLLVHPNSYLTGKLVDWLYTRIADWNAKRKGRVTPTEKRLAAERLALIRESGLWTDKGFIKYLRKAYPEFRKLHESVFNEVHHGAIRDRLWIEYIAFLYEHRNER